MNVLLSFSYCFIALLVLQYVFALSYCHIMYLFPNLLLF